MRIRLAFCSCAELPEDLTAAISALRFGEGEVARLNSIRHPAAKRESLAALCALSLLCGDDAWTVVRDVDGKPRFLEQGAPHFNLSHAGGLAVAALCEEAAVGVDLEFPRDAAKEAAVAARYFTPSEQALFAARGDFAALWTRKEACAKCLGVPLSSVLSRDISLITRTYRVGEATLSLAADCAFEVEVFDDFYSIQEVIL